ncbi:uncharacterized protein LOC119283661 [Triticum dicoccoides]|uniref:uncharacterized protein LOC119283661 n=1 Tax=Triticum dicoccoides TaxID=85692 RepID=UPI001890AABE|nr:uncharacterized protein LOC119283661 [Triticum dicoccoides]
MAMQDHPSPCGRHPQILLDRKCLVGQLKNSTTAKTKNSKGHHLELSFKAVDPPAISLCLVSCVDQTGELLPVDPRILGEAGGSVLLAFTFFGSVHHLPFTDYFVYKAGPNFPCVHLIPRPYPSSFEANLVAILPVNDNSEDFAVVFPHVEYFGLESRKHYTLHIYRSDANDWHTQVAHIAEDNGTRIAKRKLLLHDAMSVAYAENGIIGWIDLWWGILLCNVLDKKPIIRFVPLPVPEPCDASEFHLTFENLTPRPHRHVTIFNDLIKFVELDFHVQDAFCNMKRGKDYGWMARTWSRSIYSDIWHDGLTFDTSELSFSDSSLPNLLPEMFDDKNSLTWGNLTSAGPTLSLHDDNVIYIMAKESMCHRTAYVLAVNGKSLKLESGAPCSAENMLWFEPTYDPCVLFRSFVTTSESVKEFETKGTISETKEGLALSVVSKRLRALRKKQDRIAQMEESVAAGKVLNQDQKEVMHSKPIITALIDELERLRVPLSTALTKELSTVPAPAAGSSSFGSDLSIQDLLALVYFGSLFYVKSPDEFITTMVARKHERSSCITYGYVWDDTVDLLTENDLDAVSAVAALATARPASAVGVSHHDALQACAHHARLWLTRADVPIHPGSSVTYAAVRSKLDRIMASNYYTAHHGSESVQALMSMTVSPEAPSLKENIAAEGHKEEEEDSSHATEIYNGHQSNAADVQNMEGKSPVNPHEEYPLAEAEQEKFDVEEQDQRYAEPKERQFQRPRRSFQNQRGGDRGRRGAYPNGHGRHGGGRGMGSAYQNGRGGGGGGGYQGGGDEYQNGWGGGGGYQGGYQNGSGAGGAHQGGYLNGRGGGGHQGGC